MDARQPLAKNLAQQRMLLNMSMEEFSCELGIPKSTLQSILKTGNTTTNTLLQISDYLCLSPDALLGDELSESYLQPLSALMPLFEWFTQLSQEQQIMVISHLLCILEVLQK